MQIKPGGKSDVNESQFKKFKFRILINEPAYFIYKMTESNIKVKSNSTQNIQKKTLFNSSGV
jgi:hypothetical protein